MHLISVIFQCIVSTYNKSDQSANKKGNDGAKHHMDVQTTMTLAEWFTNPIYFGMLLTVAMISGSGGFAIGILISRPFWDYIAEGRRFKREDREAERQRKETAAQRSLEYNKELEAKKRVFAGIFFDECGTPCCPYCRVPLHEIMKSNLNGCFFGTCSKCGKKIYSNARYETIQQHIEALRNSNQ